MGSVFYVREVCLKGLYIVKRSFESSILQVNSKVISLYYEDAL